MKELNPTDAQVTEQGRLCKANGLVRSPEINFFPHDWANSPIFIKGSIDKTENVT